MIEIITKPYVPEVLKLEFAFYEDGDWLRIEVPGLPDRYLSKGIAKPLLEWIKLNSVKEKSEIIVCR